MLAALDGTRYYTAQHDINCNTVQLYDEEYDLFEYFATTGSKVNLLYSNTREATLENTTSIKLTFDFNFIKQQNHQEKRTTIQGTIYYTMVCIISNEPFQWNACSYSSKCTTTNHKQNYKYK